VIATELLPTLTFSPPNDRSENAMRCTVFILTFLWMTSAVTLAQADAGSSAAAEALFSEGKALANAKNFVAACPKFEASQKLDPGAGTLLHLGSMGYVH
jgi:hypothetical protein